jgi:CRISPR-associated protein Cmr2
LAGALTGYDLTTAAIERWSSDKMTLSHPYLATFTFFPSARTNQSQSQNARFLGRFLDFALPLCQSQLETRFNIWTRYVTLPQSLPTAPNRPLVTAKMARIQDLGQTAQSTFLLTAGFPNVLVLVLPKDKVSAAMQTAEQTILETWRDLGKRVFEELHEERKWMPSLHPDSNTWKGWLEVQWQTYWTAIPIGKEGESINNAAIPEDRQADFQPWLDTQNQAYNLTRETEKLFQPAELNFLRAAYQQPLEKQGKKFSVNVGSWWPHIFDQTRYALTTVKNARNWQIPTAFGPRSTISGLGPVVHPGADWVTEGDTKKYWQRQAGLFDGTEQLNATETLKRGLEKILPQLLIGGKDQPSEEEIIENIAASYPDLTAGVAGYLKVHTDADLNHRRHFHQACQAILDKFDWAEKVIKRMRSKWGVSWIDDSSTPKKYHSRFLNAGWLVEDAETEELEELQKALKQGK